MAHIFKNYDGGNSIDMRGKMGGEEPSAKRSILPTNSYDALECDTHYPEGTDPTQMYLYDADGAVDPSENGFTGYINAMDYGTLQGMSAMVREGLLYERSEVHKNLLDTANLRVSSRPSNGLSDGEDDDDDEEEEKIIKKAPRKPRVQRVSHHHDSESDDDHLEEEEEEDSDVDWEDDMDNGNGTLGGKKKKAVVKMTKDTKRKAVDDEKPFTEEEIYGNMDISGGGNYPESIFGTYKAMFGGDHPEVEVNAINMVTLTRDRLAAWVQVPHISEFCVNYFVRLSLGYDPHTRTTIYRMAKVVGVVNSDREYGLPDKTRVNHDLICQVGEQVKQFSFVRVSNSPLSYEEFWHWINRINKARKNGKTGLEVSWPTHLYVRHLREKYDVNKNYKRSDKDLEFHLKKVKTKALEGEAVGSWQDRYSELSGEKAGIEKEISDCRKRIAGGPRGLERDEWEVVLRDRNKLIVELQSQISPLETAMANIKESAMDERSRVMKGNKARMRAIAINSKNAERQRKQDALVSRTLSKVGQDGSSEKQGFDPFRRRPCKPNPLSVGEALRRIKEEERAKKEEEEKKRLEDMAAAREAGSDAVVIPGTINSIIGAQGIATLKKGFSSTSNSSNIAKNDEEELSDLSDLSDMDDDAMESMSAAALSLTNSRTRR